MPAKIIRPKDSRLPCFVLPDYEDPNESFYPFIRLPEPDNIYVKIKKLILSLTLFPIRCFMAIAGLPFFSLIGMIATINYDPTNLEHLATPLPLWRSILFKIARGAGKWGLIWYGFHNLSVKHYTYHDMENKFNYKPPIKIKYDKNGNEIQPQCNIVVSNHLGFADILYLMWYHNGAFVAKHAMKNVIGVGSICSSVQSLYIEKGKSTAESLLKRVKFTNDMHENIVCKGCSLCRSNMVIFPEGTTTNGNDLLMYRTGIFNSGLPIRPIIIKCKWKYVNTSWESIYFRTLSYKVFSEFINNMEVIVGPPYIPTDDEKKNGLLYAYNMNILMAQMMGINNEGRKAKIYLINRDIKVNCYHNHCVKGTDLNIICKWAKKRALRDELIAKYLDMIKNDERYLYDGNDGNQYDDDDDDVEDKSDDKKSEREQCQFQDEGDNKA